MIHKKFFQLKEWTSHTGKWGPRVLLTDIDNNRIFAGDLKEVVSQMDGSITEIKATNVASWPEGYMVEFDSGDDLESLNSYLKIMKDHLDD